jgi:hypothetical protein
MVDQQALMEQSDFTAAQTALQAPPIPPQPGHVAHKLRSRYILVALFILMALMVFIVIFSPQKTIVMVTPTPTPLPSPSAPMSSMQQMIEQVTMGVQQANPEELLLPLPEVDMAVEF